ncbi:hypothetical protein FJT64_002106 [Amphibalanus amphitrite]|uniref:Uncharacterized protein n=1 Tax=Amphibalanus amphitrite TaxID=1232801 RepID=A0A6A4X434_AMPAM|nr:hypothetical protein FJT64_002106 [Amphibalanus amphitrite]
MVFFPFPFRNWSHMMEPHLLCLIILTCPDSVHKGNSHGHFKVPPWVLSILVDTPGTVGILSVSGKRLCRLCDGESMTCDLTLWGGPSVPGWVCLGMLGHMAPFVSFLAGPRCLCASEGAPAPPPQRSELTVTLYCI